MDNSNLSESKSTAQGGGETRNSAKAQPRKMDAVFLSIISDNASFDVTGVELFCFDSYRGSNSDGLANWEPFRQDARIHHGDTKTGEPRFCAVKVRAASLLDTTELD
jgi:hypothetical protein